MKILHVIYDDEKNPWCGGGGALRTRKINEYLAANNKITVLTGNFPGAQNETINGADYIRVGSQASYLASRITFTLFIPFYMARIRSDVVVNDASYFSPCFAGLYTNRPVVHIIHHLIGRHSFKRYPFLGLFPFIAEKIFMKTCDNIITSAEGVKQRIGKRYQNTKIKAIPNGVSETLFQLKPVEKGFILFLGRIDIYMKGLDILIESFARVKNRDIVLKIAGSGKREDVRRLHRLAGDPPLEGRVEILGRVTELEKLEILRTCLFVVMPSRFEGWGIVALEANAAGKPVLGTAINGLSEAVVPGKSALLVEPDNIEKLTDAMSLLIESSDLRANLGKAGRVWARSFSWDSIAQEQFIFYESLVNG